MTNIVYSQQLYNMSTTTYSKIFRHNSHARTAKIEALCSVKMYKVVKVKQDGRP